MGPERDGFRALPQRTAVVLGELLPDSSIGRAGGC
jgi:hypothetical protein